MKINRLIEIIIILINRKTVTAAELAKRFQVSTRTIYRDIDVLSGSGIPVFSTQGINGGISLLDDFTLNRTALTKKEIENIIFALQSMQATKYPQVEVILEKLGALFKSSSTDWISIDFSSWGANPNAYNKFDMVKDAVMQNKVIEFDYINANNKKSHRLIAPLRLNFKSQAWYLWGYCYQRNDFRTFRISRIKNIMITEESFERNRLISVVADKEKKEIDAQPPLHLVLEFREEMLYRLYDDYDETMFYRNENGTYTLEVVFSEDEWLYGYILSFGAYVKVISPEHIKDIIYERSRQVVNLYLD